MPSEKYFFQQKKTSFTYKFFKKGFTAASYILFVLAESGEGFLESLPDSYPQFALMKQLFGVGKYKQKKFSRETIRVNLHRLKKQGLVMEDPKKKVYCLTDEGKELTLYIKDRFAVLKKPWDRKFRIVVFDIPKAKKEWRRWLRQELILLQFEMLQESVYIGKHPLSRSFYQEVNEAGLSKYIFVLTAGEIDKKEEVFKLFQK